MRADPALVHLGGPAYPPKLWNIPLAGAAFHWLTILRICPPSGCNLFAAPSGSGEVGCTLLASIGHIS